MSTQQSTLPNSTSRTDLLSDKQNSSSAAYGNSQEENGAIQTTDEQSSVLLLPKFEVVPTSSRRLVGLKDLGLLALMVVPFIFFRGLRNVLSWLGVAEHRVKGKGDDEPLSKMDKEKLQDVVVVLRGNKLPEPVLRAAVVAAATGSDAGPCNRVLAHLSAVTTALEDTANRWLLPYDEVQQQAVFRKLADVLAHHASGDYVNVQDVLKSLRKAGKAAVRHLVRTAAHPHVTWKQSDVLNAFVYKLLMETTRSIPPVEQHVVLELPDGQQLVESISLITSELSLAYLRTQPLERFQSQIGFISAYNRMRPSDAKKEEEVQAMSINARVHTLSVRRKDGSLQEVASCPRSGAYATHGRKPRKMGLSGLMRLLDFCDNAQPLEVRAALDKWRFSSREELAGEVETRLGCCISQALPVVVNGILTMCRRPVSMEAAYKSGSFLMVQQSLLSDCNPREGAYLQDAKGALDVLSQRLQIRFVFKPTHMLEVQSDKRIMLSLDRDTIPDSAIPSGVTRDEVLSRTYGLTVLVFSCGVNVLQSLGFLMPPDNQETVQDIINRQSLMALNDYALQAGCSPSSLPALRALNRHYSPGAERPPKDTESIWLVRRAAKELGAVRAINCKSGKDRTAMEIAISFTQEAAEAVGLSPSQQAELKRALQEGLSYRLTAQNHGRPACYAFNEFELITLPPGWAPSWRTCGKVLS